MNRLTGKGGDAVLSSNYHLQLGHFTVILDATPQSIAGFLFLFVCFLFLHSFKGAGEMGVGGRVPGQALTF